MTRFVGLVFALFALGCIVAHCVGCSSPSTLAADSAYTTEQLRCVDQAKTLDESRQCRQLVRERWGVDGGAR